MIGILCSDHLEKKYSEEFHSIYKNVGTKRDDSIIVFTTSNINFTKKTVTGSLISNETIITVLEPLPSIIFNLSLQRDMNGIKTRKKLEEMMEITLINDANKYDQFMLMDMLSSSKKTQKYLLPYHNYNKKNRDFKADDNRSYITMPARGANLSRIIFTKPVADSERLTGTQYFKKGHICDYIDASLCQKQWLFIDVPELITINDHPVIARIYIQKTSIKSWKILGKGIFPEFDFKSTCPIQNLEDASLVLIDYINHFLPSLGVCFIDFMISTDGKPYFLHFNGFNEDFFDLKPELDFFNRFYKNIIGLAGSYRHMHKEGF